MAIKLIDMMNEYTQDLCTSFCGEPITIPAGKIIYSCLANKYKDIAIDAHNKFQEKCLKVSSWENVDEVFLYFDEARNTVAKAISEDAISVKYYSVDQQNVIRMCDEQGFFDPVYSLITEFYNQVQLISEQCGLISEGLEEEKENRAKFGAITLSSKVTDAVKTQFKADILNAAVGLVYDAKNKNTKSKVQKAAEEKISSLFGSLKMNIILPALSSLEKMFSVLVSLIDEMNPGKIVKNAIASTYTDDMDISKEEWQKLVKSSDIRIQWDPEKDIEGRNMSYRSIQLGIRNNAVKEYVNDWIVQIEDITPYVKELNLSRRKGIDITPFLPNEQVYPLL